MAHAALELGYLIAPFAMFCALGIEQPGLSLLAFFFPGILLGIGAMVADSISRSYLSG